MKKTVKRLLVTLSKIFDALMQKRKWSVVSYHGEWIKGLNAGGSGLAPYEGTSFICFLYHLHTGSATNHQLA